MGAECGTVHPVPRPLGAGHLTISSQLHVDSRDRSPLLPLCGRSLDWYRGADGGDWSSPGESGSPSSSVYFCFLWWRE